MPIWVPLVFIIRGVIVDTIRSSNAVAKGMAPFALMRSPLGKFIVAGKFVRALYAVVQGRRPSPASRCKTRARVPARALGSRRLAADGVDVFLRLSLRGALHRARLARDRRVCLCPKERYLKETGKAAMKLAIFDIDGTLVDGSTERRFWRYLLQAWPSRSAAGRRVPDVLAALPAGLRAASLRRRTRRISTGSTRRACGRWPRASSPKRFCRASTRRPCSGCRATCGAATPSCSCPGRWSRSRGRSRARSACAHVCATVCRERNGRYLARPPETHPFGAAKLELAAQFAAEIGATLSEASAYGDSHDDLDLLAGRRRSPSR